HHGVTGIDTSPTTDTHVLQAIPDIDAGRTYLHAQTAIDAIAHPCFFMVDFAGAAATRLATFVVIRDDECVVIDHHALEARVRAHVFANCFTHEAGVAPRGKGVEQHPEPLPGPKRQGEHASTQLTDGSKIANKCEASPERDEHPNRVLRSFQAQLARIPGLFIQTN